jgi:hypothetical protein
LVVAERADSYTFITFSSSPCSSNNRLQQSINQSISQSVNQSINQSIKLSMQLYTCTLAALDAMKHSAKTISGPKQMLWDTSKSPVVFLFPVIYGVLYCVWQNICSHFRILIMIERTIVTDTNTCTGESLSV